MIDRAVMPEYPAMPSAMDLLNTLAMYTVVNPHKDYAENNEAKPEGRGWAVFDVDQPGYRASLEVVRVAQRNGWRVYDEALMRIDNDDVFASDDEAVLAAVLAGVRLIKLPDKIGSPYYRWYLCIRKTK